MSNNISPAHLITQAADAILKHQVDRLDVIPAVAIKLLRLTNDENSSISDLSHIIQTEPTLTAKVLRNVNSAAFALPHKVTSIKRAINILGFSAVRQLTLNQLFYKKLVSHNTKQEFDRLFFWQHCLFVASLSRAIASALKHEDPDSIYVAGLMHDIGKIVLESHGKVTYSDFVLACKNDKQATLDSEHDFFGLTLMSGYRPHINDEFSAMLWGLGGSWFKPHYNKENKIQYFKVQANDPTAVKVAQYYLQLLEFAHPAHDQWAFLESANALAQGRVAMWPFAYNNLWPVSAKLENNIPYARIGIAQVPLKRPYNGAYATAVSYSSQNPEAAYWLLKYMGSYEGQMAYALGGGNPCRKDVVMAEHFQDKEQYSLSGAFRASHEANLLWTDKVLELGHFNSTAMGKIYPELMNTTYQIRSGTLKPQQALNQLNNKIMELQNRYGEAAAIK